MKTIGEFLNELEDELKYLNPKDRSDVLKHYRDKINNSLDYGESEQKIIATMLTPEKIAEEIYKSKGITYLEKRKKELKRNKIIKSIFSGILILILFIGFLAASYYFINSIIKFFQLTYYSFSFFNFLDTTSLILFNISYILIALIVYIYIFDLFYLIIMHFLQIILDSIYNEIKDYPFMDFTISSSIEKILKKKKFLPKLLLIFFCCLLGFGIISYASKGYIYRSLNNTISSKEKIIIEDQITKIEIESNDIFVKISSSNEIDNINIHYSSEFEEKLPYEINNGVLKINKIKLKKFDPFGLLNEPQPIVEIILPKNNKLEDIMLNFTGGVLDVVDLDNSINIEINGSDFTAAFTRTSINGLKIEGLEMKLALEDNSIKNMSIKMQSGRFCAVNDIYDGFDLGNYLGDIILQNVKWQTANIENISGKSAIDKLDTKELNYRSIRSQDYFKDNIFEKLNFFGGVNSNIQIERLIVKDELKIEEDDCYLKIDSCKSRSIVINGSGGNNTFYNLGKNVDENSYDDSLKSYINRYNNEYNELTAMSFDTNSGSILFSSSKLSSVDFNLIKTNLTINYCNIDYTHLIANESSININDLEGKTIFVNTTKGGFMFYNDSISKSEIVLSIQTNGTTVGIGDNINIQKEE